MDGTNDLEAPLVLSDTAAAPGVRPSVQFRDAAVKEIPDEKKKAIRQLGFAIGLCFIFMVGEIVGGVFSGSIAIMTECVAPPAPTDPLRSGPVTRCRPRERAEPAWWPSRPSSKRSWL